MNPVCLRAVLAAVVVSAAGSAPALTLHGRVVDLEGAPAVDARLQIVGHTADVAIRNPSGEFEQPLAGSPSQVQVAAIAGPLEVLFPRDGVVPVPADETVVITVVVGRGECSEITQLLAERLVKLENALAANGVRFDAVRDSLSADLRQVLTRLDVGEAELRRSVAFQREQAATAPEIMRAVDAYVREVKDLRDNFAQLGFVIGRDRDARDALRRNLEEYNQAFTLLNDNRHAFESKILSYWGPSRGELLGKYLADLYLEAVENIHGAVVLPLNPRFVELQAPPDLRGWVEAATAITAGATALATRIPALEQRAAELRAALDRNRGAPPETETEGDPR